MASKHRTWTRPECGTASDAGVVGQLRAPSVIELQQELLRELGDIDIGVGTPASHKCLVG